MSWLLAPAIIISMILVARLLPGRNQSKLIYRSVCQTINHLDTDLIVCTVLRFWPWCTETDISTFAFYCRNGHPYVRASLGRIILNCWGPFSIPYFAILPLVIKTLIAALLWTLDIYRKRDGRPSHCLTSLSIC